MRVLAIASEIFPLIKTGGLADVTGALPGALAHLGVELRTLVPGYPVVMAALADTEPVHAYPDLHGGAARILRATAAGLHLFVLDAPHLYDRPGNPYMDPAGRDWPDNPQRFAALARAGADIGLGAVPGWLPAAIHCHDWQTGLAPAYLHYAGGARPRTVMTIHNLSFTGQVPLSLQQELGLPPESLSINGVEFYQSIGFMKAGLYFADALTTVSPTYAQEIQTQASGCGFDGLLRGRRADLHGILNGIDPAVWDPWSDPHLPARFRKGHLRGKLKDKAALQQRLGLDAAPERLLCGVVSRLTYQKGVDLVLAALPDLLARGGQLAVLGSGDSALEAGFQDAAAAHPGQVGVVIGYDEALAHLVMAGSDALLIPSRFEPCGLTQLSAQRYGTLPVVTRVGGLADTVIDANHAAMASGVMTGLVMGAPDADGMVRALGRAAELWALPKQWQVAQRNAMAAVFGWADAAAAYKRLYEGKAA